MILRMIHLLAASIWLGSMVFFALVIVPAIRRAIEADKRNELIIAIGSRYRIFGWATLGVLLVTGPLLVIQHGDRWHSTFGLILTFKLILIMTMLIFLLIHDFILAPKMLAVKDPKREGKRKTIALLARINLLIVVVIRFCGVWLTFV
ncbi:MAG: DUF4149 domain-containing protein [Nitrospiria bacterium]